MPGTPAPASTPSQYWSLPHEPAPNRGDVDSAGTVTPLEQSGVTKPPATKPPATAPLAAMAWHRPLPFVTYVS
ncbi:hypothetical protein SAMN02745947_05226 [Rhodococcus rhodochrous J3]|uniref:Uncharacterized protein n=1 Tax=Rhodococcus rhodochrous J3 TaxID=903528 RepID=A0ABY1MII1_RHORH|nr:hypothetical protein SAMN02745947_05226 [Rhodococcus rhodochrous J3]